MPMKVSIDTRTNGLAAMACTARIVELLPTLPTPFSTITQGRSSLMPLTVPRSIRPVAMLQTLVPDPVVA